MIFNSKARSSFYCTHVRIRPLLSREPVARKLVTAPLLADYRPLKRKQGWALKQGLNHTKSRNRQHGRGGCLSRGQIISRRVSGKLLRKFIRNPRRVQRYIHRLLHLCSARPSPKAKQRWVLKQGLNHTKSRIRGHGRGGRLSRG